MTATATPKVYAAIAAVTADLSVQGIAKDSKNQQQGYSFRGIDAIYNELSPILAKHKLCILPRILHREVVERQTMKGGTLFNVTVEAEFDMISAEDGSKHTIRTFGEAMDSADKATNKAMSAAYKYAAMQAFCIPTEGDNDADGTTHEVAPKQQPQTQQQRAPATPAETYARLSKANAELTALADFNKFWSQPNVTAAFDTLGKDARQKLGDERSDKAAELEEREALREDAPPFDDRGYTAPDFDHMPREAAA